jgi:hypothetical protein
MAKTKNVVTRVLFSDWVMLIVNGKLIYENHSTPDWERFPEIKKLKGNYEEIEVDVFDLNIEVPDSVLDPDRAEYEIVKKRYVTAE